MKYVNVANSDKKLLTKNWNIINIASNFSNILLNRIKY